MESPFYGLQPAYPLTVPAEQVYNRQTLRYEGSGEPLEYEVFAERRSSQADTEDPGLDQNRMTLECQVVRSPDGRNLLLPLKAGDTFELTFRGRTGTAEVLPVPNADLAGLPEEYGEEFVALWTAVG